MLSSPESKTRLIHIISEYLLSKFEFSTKQSSLYVTCKMCEGVVLGCEEIMSKHEEADVIIPFQVNNAIEKGHDCIEVQSEDTDVFCLLLHFYHTQN